MSGLGSISGKIQREAHIMDKLNDAVMIIEADTLRRSKDFGFSSKDISNSYQYINDFASRLHSVLKHEVTSIDFQPIINGIDSGVKPLNDWIEDLEKLMIQTQKGQKLETDSLSILEDILSLLDTQFTDDLQRLYIR